jgi:chromosome partitioning protein
MADYRTNITNEVIEEARKFFKEKVYNTVIPRNVKLTEAPGFGKPIALYDKVSIGAQRYKAFADELLGVNKEIQQPLITEAQPNILSDNDLSKLVAEGEIK